MPLAAVRVCSAREPSGRIIGIPLQLLSRTLVGCTNKNEKPPFSLPSGWFFHCGHVCPRQQHRVSSRMEQRSNFTTHGMEVSYRDHSHMLTYVQHTRILHCSKHCTVQTRTLYSTCHTHASPAHRTEQHKAQTLNLVHAGAGTPSVLASTPPRLRRRSMLSLLRYLMWAAPRNRWRTSDTPVLGSTKVSVLIYKRSECRHKQTESKPSTTHPAT